jgi:hypothetical protein
MTQQLDRIEISLGAARADILGYIGMARTQLQLLRSNLEEVRSLASRTHIRQVTPDTWQLNGDVVYNAQHQEIKQCSNGVCTTYFHLHPLSVFTVDGQQANSGGYWVETLYTNCADEVVRVKLSTENRLARPNTVNVGCQ